MFGSYEKLITGLSTPLPEAEPEEGGILDEDLIEKAMIHADFNDILDSVGEPNFEYIYSNSKFEIKKLSFEKQRILCEKLTEKIEDVYMFEFYPKIVFDEIIDIEIFFDFVEFLEFKNIDFLSNILRNQDLIFLKNNTHDFLAINWDKIYENILSEAEKITNKIISIFLRTYNKEKMFIFLKNKIEKNKMLIILKNMEGE